MTKETKDIWTEIDSYTAVLKVPGGLLFNRELSLSSESGEAIGSAMCFVPMTDKDRRKWLERYGIVEQPESPPEAPKPSKEKDK